MAPAEPSGSPQPEPHQTVMVSPALGGMWLGMIVPEHEVDDGIETVEASTTYVFVRCTDQMNAPGIAPGHVYLVLRRFVSGG